MKLLWCFSTDFAAYVLRFPQSIRRINGFNDLADEQMKLLWKSPKFTQTDEISMFLTHKYVKMRTFQLPSTARMYAKI